MSFLDNLDRSSSDQLNEYMSWSDQRFEYEVSRGGLNPRARIIGAYFEMGYGPAFGGGVVSFFGGEGV